MCLFMLLGKDVLKYIEFPNLDRALDFQLHGKDCSVKRSSSIYVCLFYLKILTGFIYLQNVLGWFSNTNTSQQEFSCFFILQSLRTGHQLEDSERKHSLVDL